MPTLMPMSMPMFMPLIPLLMPKPMYVPDTMHVSQLKFLPEFLCEYILMPKSMLLPTPLSRLKFSIVVFSNMPEPMSPIPPRKNLAGCSGRSAFVWLYCGSAHPGKCCTISVISIAHSATTHASWFECFVRFVCIGLFCCFAEPCSKICHPGYHLYLYFTFSFMPCLGHCCLLCVWIICLLCGP